MARKFKSNEARVPLFRLLAKSFPLASLIAAAVKKELRGKEEHSKRLAVAAKLFVDVYGTFPQWLFIGEWPKNAESS